MKTYTLILSLIVSSSVFAEDPKPAERTGQYYEGYKRYRTAAEREFQTDFESNDAVLGGTTAAGVASYVRNPYNGTILTPPRPAGAGVAVMSDAHLDAKLFMDWVDKGRPANHPFTKTYEGTNFRKFMDSIPEQIKKQGKGLTSMDIVWGGDPFDRKGFESIPGDSEILKKYKEANPGKTVKNIGQVPQSFVDDARLTERKKAFSYFAEELKRMAPVDGVQYNFVASLGDHEVTKVNGSWDNATAWKAAKVNGSTTAQARFKELKQSALDDIVDKNLAEILEREKAAGRTPTPEQISEWKTKIAADPDNLKDASEVAKKNYKAMLDGAGRPPQIDIPKVDLGKIDDLDALPKSAIDRLKSTKLKDGTSLYAALKSEIAKGGVIDANNSALHREILEKYGKVYDDMGSALFGKAGDEIVDAWNLQNPANQVDNIKSVPKEFADDFIAKRLTEADKLDGFMKTRPKPIGVVEGDMLKRNGVKPPARARQLNGIDDQLQISKYSDEFADVFEKAGFRVDRSTFSPYQATVHTAGDGRQYAHRHVQYGNSNRVIIEKKQVDAIIGNNTRPGNGSRIRLPEVRVELKPGQADEIKALTNITPDELLGKATITDDVFKQLEDVVKKGKVAGATDEAKALAARAEKLLSADGSGLLKGQHAISVSSSTADGMRKANVPLPGRTDVLENAGQQAYGQHIQGKDGRIVQNHSKTTGAFSDATDVRRVNGMGRDAVLFTSDTHNPSMNFAAAADPELAAYMDELCPGCVGTRPEINSGSMSAKAKNPNRPNAIAVDFGNGPTHLQIDDTGKVVNFDAVPKEQREWLEKLKKAQSKGDDAFVKFLMDPETGRDPITKKSMLGDDPVDALRNILPCK